MATTGMGRSTRGVWAKRLAAAVAIAALGLTACSREEEPEKSAVELAVERNAEYYKNAASDNGGDDDASDGGEAGGFTMPPENEGILPPDRANYPGIDSETDEGAQQTTRFFFDALYYGYATGDTEPLESVSSKNCTQCNTAIRGIHERTQVDGLYVVGHSIEANKIHVTKPENDKFTAVYYAYHEGAAQGTSADEGRLEFPERDMHSVTDLAFVDEQWRVFGVAWEEDVDE